MATQMNLSEYESLRAENISRIQTITTLDNSVLVVTGSLWVAVAAISGDLITNNDTLRWIIQTVLLTIAAVLILVTALKNAENVHQIIVISSYIKVYYEYPSRHSHSAQPLLSWETMQMQTNTLRTTQWSERKNRLYRTVFNGSYLILEIATHLILATVLINAGIGKLPIFYRAVILSALLAIGLVMISMIVRLTFVGQFTNEEQKRLLERHAKKALALGVIDETMYVPRPETPPETVIAEEIIREMTA